MAPFSGIYFQRCEVAIENNTILDDLLLIKMKKGPEPGTIKNNVIWRDLSRYSNFTILPTYRTR